MSPVFIFLLMLERKGTAFTSNKLHGRVDETVFEEENPGCCLVEDAGMRRGDEKSGTKEGSSVVAEKREL